MNSAERRLHADTCYKAFHNRAVALFAWTDMVLNLLVGFIGHIYVILPFLLFYFQTINKVIEPEFNKVRQELMTVTKQVRDVRFSTIQTQVLNK